MVCWKLLWLALLLAQTIAVSMEESDVNKDKSEEQPLIKPGKSTIFIGLIVTQDLDNEFKNDSAGYPTLPTILEEALQRINASIEPDNPIGGFQLVVTSLVQNSIEMSDIVCKQLIGNKLGGVSTVIVDTDSRYLASIAALSFTLGLYNIPVIGTGLRDSSLFNKDQHATYVSLIPPYSHQADIWFNLMVEFQFKRAFVLTSSENRFLLMRFVDLIDQQTDLNADRRRLEAIIEYDADAFTDTKLAEEYLVSRLRELIENSICRVFFIHAQSTADVTLFLDAISKIYTQDAGFALILSEEFVQIANENKIKLPGGIISSQLSPPDSKRPVRHSYALDALDLITRSVLDLNLDASLNDVPNTCKFRSSNDWQTGVQLSLSIQRQSFVGRTGRISFDENGDRITASYRLMNLHHTQNFSSEGKAIDGDQSFKTIGFFNNDLAADGSGTPRSENIHVDISSILWPDGQHNQLISGVYVSKHLKIITLQEKPFVWVADAQECQPTNETDRAHEARFVCEKLDRKREIREVFCCKGYCMDLLAELSTRLNFTFDLYLATDNLYGSLEVESDEDWALKSNESDTAMSESRISNQRSNEVETESSELSDGARASSRLRWTGLMSELVSKRVDMAFAPLTITPQRAQAIDFSKPFKFHGFSILLRRASKHTTLASFLQPFHDQLWVLVIGIATHVVALTFYLLDRYSIFGRFGMKRHFIAPQTGCNNHDEHPLHLSSSLWFSWSILLNSGVGEHTPKSLSGRVLGIFWSAFAMIVVASYTANLAAFLVLDSREETPTLSGIDDPRLRSGDFAFNFATVRGSAVDAYLQSQVEYINLYRKMEEFSFGNVDDAINALRTGNIDALIWDSTRLEWEVARDERCSLGIAGELFGSGGYGIGLQRDSYWTKNITTKLLELHESGFMEELDQKWIAPVLGKGGRQTTSPTCDRHNDDNPETLGIYNIAGVFILFACGLITSLVLIFIERLCYGRLWWRAR